MLKSAHPSLSSYGKGGEEKYQEPGSGSRRTALRRRRTALTADGAAATVACGAGGGGRRDRSRRRWASPTAAAATASVAAADPGGGGGGSTRSDTTVGRRRGRGRDFGGLRCASSRWDLQGGAFDRSRGNRRNWILVWEDGFCNFAASTGNGTGSHHGEGLQPELFFKMSHEIYNYGEGLIGKVAADHSHKWVFKEPQEHDTSFVPAWHSTPADSHPRTWEAQFQAGIKTIALVAVREGVIQLGAVNEVMEDLSYIVLLRKKLSYLESIPGALLPHPSSSAIPLKINGQNGSENWVAFNSAPPAPSLPPVDSHRHHLSQQGRITPSMSSLEALLSKLPSISPPFLPPPPVLPGCLETPTPRPLDCKPVEIIALNRTAKEGDKYQGFEEDREMARQSYYASTTGPGTQY